MLEAVRWSEIFRYIQSVSQSERSLNAVKVFWSSNNNIGSGCVGAVWFRDQLISRALSTTKE